MQLLKLALFIAIGFTIARITGIQGLGNDSWYGTVVASLLAIGLYASTYGIDLKEARQHLRIIVSAVTIGVVLKALIIGGSLAFLFQDPFFFVLGIAVAQIDPLSVAGLLKGDRMSPKAKTILASWASFDDPVTVILSVYAPLLVAHMTGLDLGPAVGSAGVSSGATGYVQGLGLNFLLAGGAFVAWLFIRNNAKKRSPRVVALLSIGAYMLLGVVFSISVVYFTMLGIALVGLFLRPAKIDAYIEHAVTWALRAAAIVLGLLLVGGVYLWKGVALGVAAYFAQVIVGFLLTRGLPEKDRWHISFAQQNGITAIILALLFEPMHTGTVAIVAPAIIVINSLNWALNKIVDRRLTLAETLGATREAELG